MTRSTSGTRARTLRLRRDDDGPPGGPPPPSEPGGPPPDAIRTAIARTVQRYAAWEAGTARRGHAGPDHVRRYLAAEALGEGPTAQAARERRDKSTIARSIARGRALARAAAAAGALGDPLADTGGAAA